MVIDNLIQRSMIDRYVLPEYNSSHWAVVHPDIHCANLLVDKDWKITG